MSVVGHVDELGADAHVAAAHHQDAEGDGDVQDEQE